MLAQQLLDAPCTSASHSLCAGTCFSDPPQSALRSRVEISRAGSSSPARLSSMTCSIQTFRRAKCGQFCDPESAGSLPQLLQYPPNYV